MSDDPGHHQIWAARGASDPDPRRNPALLALDEHLFVDLPPKQLLAIKIAQLEFSRDISRRAADAYEDIRKIIAGP